MVDKIYRGTLPGLPEREEIAREESADEETMQNIQRISGETPEETAILNKSEKKTRGEDLSDLFETPQPDDHDIYTDDLTDVDTEDLFGGPEDMSDLTTVTSDQIYGAPMMSKAERKMRRRARKLKHLRRENPTSMGGVNV